MALSEPDVSKRKDASTIRQRRAKVTYSYEPQHEDELALKVGDELIISGEDEEGWYQAAINGRAGVCPSNFVELLPDQLVDDMSDSKQITAPVSTAAESTAKELKDKLNIGLGKKDVETAVKRQSGLDPPSGGNGVAAATDKKVPDSPDDTKTEISAKKVRGVGLGNIFGGTVPSIASLRSTDADKNKPTGSVEKKTSTGTANEAKKDTTTTTAASVEYAKADYDYQALNPDELSFKVGDIIGIITKECEDDGWWRGELNGHSGVFPDNFCTVIPLSEVPSSRRSAKPISSEKGGSIKKDDRNEKENHDRLSKVIKDAKGDKTKSSESLDNDKREKVEKAPKKDDRPPEKSDSKTSSTDLHADKDKIEKSQSSLKKDDTTTKSTLASASSKSQATLEKKPERPEKPVTKPAVGKKPTAGASRESTPPVHDKDAKPELKTTTQSPAQPASEAKSKPDLSSDKQPDESRPRGLSGASSGVRMRNAPDSGDSKAPTAVASSTENGGVGFDSVNSAEKLVHPTASRARGPTRRPPSQLFRPPSDEEGVAIYPINGSNGVDSPSSEDMTKDREPKVDNRKSTSSLSKNDSFLKQLDSALSHPKSPTHGSRSELGHSSSTTSSSLDEEVKRLREEVKSLKTDFAAQIKELRDTVKQQADKISALEKELEKTGK